MNILKRNICIVIFVFAAFSLGAGASSAKADFKFAPSRAAVANSQQNQSSDITAELSTISLWENKIVEVVPPGIRSQFAKWDLWRSKEAVIYQRLSDGLMHGKSTAPKTEQSMPAVYYWYSFLAVFFGYAYIFYGVIILSLFFLLRMILLRLNIIA